MTKFSTKRKFILEGKLTKAKSGRKLIAYLFNDMILFIEPARDQYLREFVLYREVRLL